MPAFADLEAARQAFVDLFGQEKGTRLYRATLFVLVPLLLLAMIFGCVTVIAGDARTALAFFESG
jgi:hypothetical protein